MLDESSNPQPTDPPTGTGTGGGSNIATDVEEPQLDEVQAAIPATDPPTGSGSGGS
jgi:hypothetical protein